MKYEQSNKHSIQSLFNEISPHYDTLNDVMSFGQHRTIKKKAIKNAIKFLGKEPQKILDICTGTGDIARKFREACPHADIIGVDFSANMLEIAKNASNDITYLEKDVTDLGNESPLEKNSFDIIFISFGLRNLPNIDEFIKNIKEYLKTDGVLSILDVGKPYWFMKPYFYVHYKLLIPFAAKMIHKNVLPYDYLISSSEGYPHQKIICQKLHDNGYLQEKNINYSFGVIAQQLAKVKNATS